QNPKPGDGCLNGLDRQQMVLFALHLDTPGPAGGPTVLDQCPMVRPFDLTSGGGDERREQIVDTSISRAFRAIVNDGNSGTDLSVGIDMDASGVETRAMFTLEFPVESIEIDGASFPAANADVRRGRDAPPGTTIAVNAAQAGLVTIIID